MVVRRIKIWKRRGVLIALRAHRHLERSREISMAECSLPDVRQHLDIVSPQCIPADFRSAVEIEGCARDDDAGKSQSLVTSHSRLLIPRH